MLFKGWEMQQEVYSPWNGLDFILFFQSVFLNIVCK